MMKQQLDTYVELCVGVYMNAYSRILAMNVDSSTAEKLAGNILKSVISGMQSTETPDLAALAALSRPRGDA